MSFVSTVCPTCSRDIQIPSDLPNPTCPYCAAPIPREAAAPAATISTLLGLARTAIAAGNTEEALSYFNRVLEADPRNSEAWIGKGKAAGWQSSIKHMRLPEMLIAFGHAVANAGDERKTGVVEEATEEANRLVVTLYGMCRKHMLEYVSLPKMWPEYVKQVAQMIDALDKISKWDPSYRLTFENIVHLCKDNIEGVSYHDKFNRNIPKSWTLTPQYESLLKSKLDMAAARLSELDPDYAPPSIVKKKADGCFVVTAAMGDFNHPTVVDMRRFRDEWLSEKPWGPALIDWYYRHGPAAADFIARSATRRDLARRFVIDPLHVFAMRLMHRP